MTGYLITWILRVSRNASNIYYGGSLPHFADLTNKGVSVQVCKYQDANGFLDQETGMGYGSHVASGIRPNFDVVITRLSTANTKKSATILFQNR